MKKLLSISLLLLSISSMTCAEVISTTNKIPEIRWKDYSSNVFNEAKINMHPVLLYITSNTCGWCEEMENTTFHNRDVINIINDNYYPVTINGSKNRKLIKSYKINSIPSIIVFDLNGNAVHIFSGYHAPEETLIKLKKLSGPEKAVN